MQCQLKVKRGIECGGKSQANLVSLIMLGGLQVQWVIEIEQIREERVQSQNDILQNNQYTLPDDITVGAHTNYRVLPLTFWQETIRFHL